MTSLILCNFFHIWADALIVNPCAKFRCDRSTNNEDNRGGGGGMPPPKPKYAKKPSPISVNGLILS